MLKLKYKKVNRTYQCDMAGCRNRTNLLWSRRGDISSRPMHICNDCIKEMFYAVMESHTFDPINDSFAAPVEAKPEVPDLSPAGGIEEPEDEPKEVHAVEITDKPKKVETKKTSEKAPRSTRNTKQGTKGAKA